LKLGERIFSGLLLKEHALYVLEDPTTDEIRYVGYTCDVRRRFSEHRKRRHSYTSSWIQSLHNKGLQPRLRVLCYVQDAFEAKRLEVELIAKYRRRGVRLTNGTEGGDGVVSTPETRAKQIAAATGVVFTAERKANISAALKKLPVTQERLDVLNRACRSLSREQILLRNQAIAAAKLGQPLSEFHCRRISETAKARWSKAEEQRLKASWTPERGAKISAAKKGKPLSEENKAAIRAAAARPEVKAKQSAARKLWWARRKAFES